MYVNYVTMENTHEHLCERCLLRRRNGCTSRGLGEVVVKSLYVQMLPAIWSRVRIV